MATLKDLARRLELSVTQVSRALNDHDDVSRATKARVHTAALEIGYRPNAAARKLRAGRSGIVAMIVPPRSETVEIEILMETVMSLSAAFSRRGMQFVLHVLSPGEAADEAHVRMVRGGSVDGVIVTDPQADDPRIAVLASAGAPFVVHGRDRDAPPYAFVDIDNRAVGSRLALALADRGCRRIALVDGPAERPFAARRRAGVHEVARTRGMVLVADRPGPMTEARGFAAGREIAAVDGVIAGNMMLATGLRRARPDLLIAAHDDGLPRHDADTVGPPLVRTLSRLDAASEPLVTALEAAISGEIRQIVLPLDLIGGSAADR